MIILKQTDLAQTISLFPNGDLTLLLIKEDGSNVVQSINVNSEDVGYYKNITSVFDLVEDKFYTIKGYNTDLTKFYNRVEEMEAVIEADIDCLDIFNNETDDLVIYDRIFCTNQSKYSINKGSYKENATGNEYVIIE